MVGCCRATHRHHRASRVSLPVVEAVVSALILGLAAILGQGNPALGGGVAIGGHLIQLLTSRYLRDCWSWGWPPLRQPGAELAPLYILTALVAGSL